MNTNHNRIKVSDLETDEPDKILATNSNGELEFIATKNIKIDSYNALDYDQEGKALDARQGKILKDLVNNKTDKGGFQGTAQDLANSIPDLNAANLKLGGYPNTRNDGQLPTNRVLGTDENGNLKMYTIATTPAPFINELIPDSYLPNTRGDITIRGEFFIPFMCDIVNNPTGIVIGGVNTIHYATFINSGEIKVNVTTGDVEGNFSCTLNNGLSTTKNNALLIVLGTVFIPKPTEWINISGSAPDVTAQGEVALSVYNTIQSCQWNKNFDYTKDIAIRFKYRRSSLGIFPNGQRYSCLEVRKASGNVLLEFQFEIQGSYANMFSQSPENGLSSSVMYGQFPDYNSRIDYLESLNPEIRYINGVFYFFINGLHQRTFTDTTTENFTLKVYDRYHDIIGIKYIELAT